MADQHRRRRRIRHQPDKSAERGTGRRDQPTGDGDPPQRDRDGDAARRDAEVSRHPVPKPPAAEQQAAPARRRMPRNMDDGVERGLRGLIGAGGSQLSTGTAMRARDAARVTEEDLAAAGELEIVRRHWAPPHD